MPLEMPSGMKRPDTLQDIVARLLYEEKQRSASEGFETPEEANDFDLEDDPDEVDMSPYQLAELEPEPNGYDQLDPDPSLEPKAPDNSLESETEASEKPPESPSE